MNDSIKVMGDGTAICEKCSWIFAENPKVTLAEKIFRHDRKECDRYRLWKDNVKGRTE